MPLPICALSLAGNLIALKIAGDFLSQRQERAGSIFKPAGSSYICPRPATTSASSSGGQ
jgi:hypothetical protein